MLHDEPAPRPFQADRLRPFVAAGREAGFARRNAERLQPEGNGVIVKR